MTALRTSALPRQSRDRLLQRPSRGNNFLRELLPALSDDLIADLITEEGLDKIERILRADRSTTALRAWVFELVRFYVLVRKENRPDLKRQQKQITAIATAASQLRRALSALEDKSLLATFSGAPRAPIEPWPGPLDRLAKPSMSSESLVAMVARCVTLESAARNTLTWYPRFRGRRPDIGLLSFFRIIAKRYHRAKGQIPSVTTDSVGDENGRGARYKGDFFELVKIILGAARAAAGEKPRTDAWLGPTLKRFARDYRKVSALRTKSRAHS
jgi:hypothetical protein